jgi:hypothetical protein
LLDAALEHRPRIDAFLRQAVTEPSSPSDSDRGLLDISDSLERSLALRSGEILDAEEVLPGTGNGGGGVHGAQTPNSSSAQAADYGDGPSPSSFEASAIPALGL